MLTMMICIRTKSTLGDCEVVEDGWRGLAGAVGVMELQAAPGGVEARSEPCAAVRPRLAGTIYESEF